MKSICISVHHEGIFTYDPIAYREGDLEVVENVDLGKTNHERLLEIVKECCQFPVYGMYYCGSKLEISKGLKPLRNDSELANFIKTAYDNDYKIELYVEHHGYDVLDGVTHDDEELDDNDSELEMEDVSEYVGLDHVGEEDVEMTNTTLTDSFLNKLVDGKYISHTDFGAKVDTPSSSLSIVDHSSVDVSYKVKEGFSYPRFNPNLPWNLMTPLLGMRFEHPDQLKDCLINYGVANGYQLWYRRNDYRNISVLCGKNVKAGRCSSQKGKQKVVEEDIGTPIATPIADAAQKGCSFKLWAGWMQNESNFQIKTLVPSHTCSRNFNLGSLVTYKWIAKQFAVEVLKNPKISYRQMVADVREKFLINVSVHQCRRAKQRAVYDLEGGLKEHYAKLWDYKDEILSTNPGSTVMLDLDTMDDGKTQFKRMYICFKAMKEGWKSCRRVVGLDGCFLKSNCKGELLTAMGRDSNNQMFPMAWAVVSVENSENWLWFLSHLGSDFNLDMGAYLTIISDGHKGLENAVKELLPHAEHRLCARHIYANFKKKWNGLHYKSLFWGAAASTLEVHFKHKMELIKNIDPLAYNWLMEREPKAWCRAFFQMGMSCASFENGISESYHSAIGFARTKPIISMLEEIRIYLMQRLVAMNQKAVRLNDFICPAIRKDIEKLKTYQRYWVVVHCGQDYFEVRKADDGFGVNLKSKTCTCKRWDLSGIPCIHAVAAYCCLNEDPGKGVSSWYCKQMWVDAYSHFIKPIGGSSMWVKSANPPPLPPKKRVMPGRPRKNRIKHVTERVNQVSRAGRYMTCSNCWEKGHNRAKCYNQTRPKPQQEKRNPGRKRNQAANQPFNPPKTNPIIEYETFEAPTFEDQSSANSNFEDLSSVAEPSAGNPSQSFTGLLYSVQQQGMSAEISDAEIAALADMNEVEEREARRKDVERVFEDAKKNGVYRKRGPGGLRGPSERIAAKKMKK